MRGSRPQISKGGKGGVSACVYDVYGENTRRAPRGRTQEECKENSEKGKREHRERAGKQASEQVKLDCRQEAKEE